MKGSFAKTRVKIGATALAFAVMFILWLPLGILGIVPFVIEIPGESGLRSHAALAIGSLLVATWGFWDQ